MREISYELLPEHMRDGARRYIEDGIPPGDFMLAVLTNNFKEALLRADRVNLYCLTFWANWLTMECPWLAQGSEAAVRGWIEVGGLKRYQEPQGAHERIRED